jgi:CheY-like chemotaxis protein
VVEAGDAEEAVHVLRASKHIDLIVTDIRMPGSMDGIALATLARSERPGIKIVLVSGDLRGVDSADYDGVFLKPYDVSGLLGLVGTLTTKEDRPTPQNCCP